MFLVSQPVSCSLFPLADPSSAEYKGLSLADKAKLLDQVLAGELGQNLFIAVVRSQGAVGPEGLAGELPAQRPSVMCPMRYDMQLVGQA